MPLADAESKKCTNCKYAYLQDVGYSNYTVEGTDFSCLKGLHPEKTFDTFYGEAPGLVYANQCEYYLKGSPIRINVEIDMDVPMTPEQIELMKEFSMLKLISPD